MQSPDTDRDSPIASDPSKRTVSLSLRRYTANDAEAWDSFVERSINGTLMHTRRFLSYHPPERFVDHSLLAADPAGRIVGVFPAGETVAQGLRTLQSHPGASYGGWVIDEAASFPVVDEVVRQTVSYADERGFQAIRIRISEKVFHLRRCEELDVAYFRAGFAIDGRELSSAFDLTEAIDDEPTSLFQDYARRNLRKAARLDVTARVSGDFEGYWQLLTNNLRNRYSVQPTHSLGEIGRLLELFPDRIFLVGGYLGDRLLSGAVVFVMNRVGGHVMYMAQDYEFQNHRSLNVVLAEALQECRRRGLRYLNYGISSIPGSHGLEINDGVYTFKRSCGGQGVTRDMLFKRVRE